MQFQCPSRPGSVTPGFPIPPALYWLQESLLCVCSARCDCVTQVVGRSQPSDLPPLLNPSPSYNGALCAFGPHLFLRVLEDEDFIISSLYLLCLTHLVFMKYEWRNV